MSTKNVRRIQILCAIAAGLLAGLGFAMVGLSWGIFYLAGLFLFWLVVRRFRFSWLTSILFLIYVGGAVVGILNGVSPIILFAGVAASLAAWELSSHKIRGESNSVEKYARLFERKRMTLLGISLFSGLLFAEAGLFMTISISFFGMVIIVLATLFCLFRFFILSRK